MFTTEAQLIVDCDSGNLSVRAYVSRDMAREHRCIDDSKTLYALHLQLVVDDLGHD